MFFRLSYSIQKLDINQAEENFQLEPDGISIRLYKPTQEDINKGTKKNMLFCDALIEYRPSDKNAEILKKIDARTPLNFGEKKSINPIIEYTFIKDKTKPKPVNKNTYSIPDFYNFPKHFQDFSLKQQKILGDAIKKISNNIMWVYNYNGSHKPFSHRFFMFSIDCVVWHHMPIGLDFILSIGETPIKINERGRKIICSQNTNVPIHHSLFLEAWNQKDINERSSFIMGLAALEGSIKFMITKNIPEASWLIENSPSPSIHAMLSEMLKKTSVKHTIEGKEKHLSEKTLNDIKKWVHTRNRLMHIGVHLPSSYDISKILTTIKSIIYLMDYYSGEDWAVNYVDKELLETMA